MFDQVRKKYSLLTAADPAFWAMGNKNLNWIEEYDDPDQGKKNAQIQIKEEEKNGSGL